MRFSSFVSVAIMANAVLALPRFTQEDLDRVLKRQQDCDVNQVGRLFVMPEPPADTSSKKIPDADHPFMAPGPTDTRGPCPMLNSLANHGYVDRSGVDTSENIIKAVREGGNMEHVFAGFVVGFATMARGNPNTAMLSIGFESDKVPVIPGCLDGPAPPGGLAKHGRFEGDVSSTRADTGVGDHVNLNSTQFNQLLAYTAQYGDDGPDGPRSVMNVRAFQEFKYDRFLEDQRDDAKLEFKIGRQLTTFTEVAFILELMQDGRYNQTRASQVSNFFVNHTFGDDFFRRNGPGGAAVLGASSAAVRVAHPIPAGANDENGNYVLDTPASTNFNCDGYFDLATRLLPAGLNKTDPNTILGKNIRTMVDAMYAPFHATANCSVQGFPSGPAGT